MRKNILKGLLCLSLALLSSALLASSVPEGKAALAEFVIGKVSVDQGKGYKALKAGQALAPASTVKTGANGRVSLRLADGSAARLAPNTELTIKDERRPGIFTRLLQGTVRFLVVRQAPGSSFDTDMANVVAAVKGTDPEYSTDGKTAVAKVFSSASAVALILTDPKSGEQHPVKAGEKLTFDGTSFKLEKLDAGDSSQSDEYYKGLPEATTEGDQEDGKAQAGAAATEAAKSDGSVDDKAIAEATDEVLAEATKELYLDGFLTRDDRTGDVAMGKIVYDRFGQRVQVSHYITRPSADTVDISSFSLRDSGPNAGVSRAEEQATFNLALPDDKWGKIFKGGLNAPDNLDGTGYAIYFKTKQFFEASNPAGDLIRINTVFQVPGWEGFAGVPYGFPLFQGRIQDVLINGQQVFTYNYDQGPMVGTHEYDTGGIMIHGIWNNTATAYQGGWNFSIAGVYSEDLHFLNDSGQVQQHPFFTGIPALPSVYQDSASGHFDANVEMAFHSPLFNGRSIDLIFLPGIFDLYQMLDLPSDSNATP